MGMSVNFVRSLLLLAALFGSSGDAFAQSVNAGARALYGAYGGVGLVPSNPPPDFEKWFAVAVIEIDSRIEVPNVTVSDFELIDQAGHVNKFKRIVEVQQFDRPRMAGEGECAYWLGSDGTRAWDGTLPSGKIRLRVRVSLAEEPPREAFGSRGDSRVAFRLTLGQHVVEGPVECIWPTG